MCFCLRRRGRDADILLPEARHYIHGAGHRKEAQGERPSMRTLRGPVRAFARLAKSKFRSRFHLLEADRKYIAEKGIETIRQHCEGFIRTRLAPASPPNDGKQAPMRGHPVFVAQHACACCCRDCLAKWWNVPRGVEIPAGRQRGIVDFLMAWIERERGRRTIEA